MFDIFLEKWLKWWIDYQSSKQLTFFSTKCGSFTSDKALNDAKNFQFLESSCEDRIESVKVLYTYLAAIKQCSLISFICLFIF